MRAASGTTSVNAGSFGICGDYVPRITGTGLSISTVLGRLGLCDAVDEMVDVSIEGTQVHRAEHDLVDALEERVRAHRSPCASSVPFTTRT